jgi:hypothetical protein
MRSGERELTIYSGRTWLGSVVEIKPSRWAAFAGRRRFLGEFASMQAAIDAVMRARGPR